MALSSLRPTPTHLRVARSKFGVGPGSTDSFHLTTPARRCPLLSSIYCAALSFETNAVFLLLLPSPCLQATPITWVLAEMGPFWSRAPTSWSQGDWSDITYNTHCPLCPLSAATPLPLFPPLPQRKQQQPLPPVWNPLSAPPPFQPIPPSPYWSRETSFWLSNCFHARRSAWPRCLGVSTALKFG